MSLGKYSLPIATQRRQNAEVLMLEKALRIYRVFFMLPNCSLESGRHRGRIETDAAARSAKTSRAMQDTDCSYHCALDDYHKTARCGGQ